MRTRKPAGSRITIIDVAKATGVSTATVSRALRAPERVSPELRERVLAAIQQLGYVTDGAARALASGRTGAVAALLPTLDNAIFAKFTNALQQRIGEHGYVLLVGSFEYDPLREGHQLRALLERGVDGVLLVGTSHSPEVYRLLKSVAIPVLICWTTDTTAPFPCIGFDNTKAAARLARHLASLGHRKIAMIAGITKGNDRAAERVAGVRGALASLKIEFLEKYLVEREYSISGGRSALRQLMQLPTPPTAVICGNDILALGALYEASALGISIPQDLSITGFDDLDFAAEMVPALTTVHVPASEMGTRVADQLAAAASGQCIPHIDELQAPIVLRDTTGAAPASR